MSGLGEKGEGLLWTDGELFFSFLFFFFFEWWGNGERILEGKRIAVVCGIVCVFGICVVDDSKDENASFILWDSTAFRFGLIHR